jgi:pentatricopeptide repeat domain-containing protein 1
VREGCERSVITYSALINACEKAGQWELALQLFERMQQEGIAPNTVTYNSLITACTQGAVLGRGRFGRFDALRTAVPRV